MGAKNKLVVRASTGVAESLETSSNATSYAHSNENERYSVWPVRRSATTATHTGHHERPIGVSISSHDHADSEGWKV